VSGAVDSILALMAPGYLREESQRQSLLTEQRERLAKLKAACAANPHGTRSRYAAGCKCMLCRAANSRYETARSLARRNGESNELVSAEKARRHMLKLSEKGIGRHSVQAASDVSDGILSAIVYGRRKNIRRQTERRILAVDEGARGGNTKIPAAPTWKLLRELFHDGYSKVQIAEWIGQKRALQLGRRRITARNASKVEKVYRLIQAGRLVRTR
jgi:hypothetical protein